MIRLDSPLLSWVDRANRRTAQVLRERARIIAEESNLSGSGDLANYASLQMMEGMLDTEAKKLEKNLRSQLRYHQSVERENVMQLDKEKSLQGKHRSFIDPGG